MRVSLHLSRSQRMVNNTEDIQIKVKVGRRNCSGMIHSRKLVPPTIVIAIFETEICAKYRPRPAWLACQFAFISESKYGFTTPSFSQRMD